MNSNEEQQLLVAVLGAGPVGLAAAAHLIERGLTSLILEAGSEVGANLATYRHVRLFSPWQYNVDKAARRLLQQHATPVIDGIDRIICAAGARPDAMTRGSRAPMHWRP
jgi:cation diffusion facilitator CzcD-associated flavoprotein CzcO